MAELVKGNTTTELYVGTISGQYYDPYYDPVSEKFKELEKRIDAWQNKFEFVEVKKDDSTRHRPVL